MAGSTRASRIFARRLGEMPQNQFPHFDESEADGPQADADVTAWTEIEEGRFMPRRVRGSCVGRALG